MHHLPDHLMRNVSINPNTQCWEWQAYCTPNGYPAATAKRKHVDFYAHRQAYIYSHNTIIPPDREINHLCYNTRCINPEHLECVTPRENQLYSPTTLASLQAARTTCPRGHTYDGVNAKGARFCRQCRRTIINAGTEARRKQRCLADPAFAEKRRAQRSAASAKQRRRQRILRSAHDWNTCTCGDCTWFRDTKPSKR